MRKTLVDLWNGTLAPVQDLGKNNEEIQHLKKLIASNGEKLENSLSEAQKNAGKTIFLHGRVRFADGRGSVLQRRLPWHETLGGNTPLTKKKPPHTVMSFR